MILFVAMGLFAQRQSFDVVNYEMPRGWDKTETENGVQLSTKDGGKGNYAAAVIVRSVASTKSPNDNFSSSWKSLVEGTVKVSESPTMSDMDIEKGWACITGQANYTDGNNKGLVTLVTATANGKMVNIVLMTNTSIYQEELLAFINSVELNEAATQNNKNNAATNAVTNANQEALPGIWGQDQSESNTSGYDWREYYFNADGTYQFLNPDKPTIELPAGTKIGFTYKPLR